MIKSFPKIPLMTVCNRYQFKTTWSMIQKVFKQEGDPFSIITPPAILTYKWHYRKTVFCR